MSTRRINLLPPEREVQRRARQLTVTIAAAGVALVVLLGIIYAAEVVRLHGQQNKLEAQEDRNADLQAQVAKLSTFDQKELELTQKTTLLGQLTQNEVRWSVVLADVSLVIPSDVWLTNFTGTVSVATAAQQAAAAGTPPPLGTIQMTGVTFSHIDVAKWLTRLAGVDAFTNAYLALSSKGSISLTDVVNFNSSVQLSTEALRKNQRGAERPL
jgi:Tfp pilus assembly protein PilN